MGYTMLTADMPWNFSFFLERDESNPIYGYLNGSKKRKIDLRTMRDAESGLEIPGHLIDPMFHRFQSVEGVISVIKGSCYLDYFTNDALDVLCRLFTSKLSLQELLQHPFVSSNPNPTLRESVINEYASFRNTEHQTDKEHAQQTAQKLAQMDEQRLSLRATLMALEMRSQNATAIPPQQQQQQQSFGEEAPSQPQLQKQESQTFILDNSDSASTLDHEEKEQKEQSHSEIAEGVSKEVDQILELPYQYSMSPSPEFSPEPSPRHQRMNKMHLDEMHAFQGNQVMAPYQFQYQ